MDSRMLDEIERQADAMVRDLQSLPFLAMVPADRLRPLCMWAVNLGLDSQAVCRVVWTAGVSRLNTLDDGEEDLLAAVAGQVAIKMGDRDDLPF